MQVNVVPLPRAAHVELFYALYSVDALRGVESGLPHGAIRRFVHQTGYGGLERAQPIHRHEERGDQRRPVIRGFPPAPAPQRDTDSNECGSGADGIAAVVPRIRDNGSAAGLFAYARDAPVEQFLDDDDSRRDEQREWRRQLVRSLNLANRHDRDADRGAKQHE
jgi:hypothetical protein